MTLDPHNRPSSGPHYTKVLFLEYSPEAPYTLKDEDVGGIGEDARVVPSLYRLYMEAEDVLEHTFAKAYLSGWAHWQALCNAPFFKPYIVRWREELELKIRSQALAKIMAMSKEQTKDTFAATKYLVDRQWVTPAEKGRPSKAQVQQKAKEIADEATRLSEDAERLGISLN